MTQGFWSKLNKPIMMLAPMADVTDAAFRQTIAKYGKPDVLFTEFVSCEGLQSPGREKLLSDLQFSEAERPIVAQVFGSRPENFYKTAQLISELGFDGLDINMGCPEKKVVKQGACADLIQHPELAKEIIQAAKEGANSSKRPIPVTVKTRVGFNTIDLERWCSQLLEAEPVAITFHWRTRKEMSKVPAHWELARIPVEMARGSGILIFGNGDVKTVAEAKEKALLYGLDGVMLGRAVFGNPWLFSERTNISINEKLAVMLEHTKLYEKLHGEQKNFALMRKHHSAYVKGFRGAGELRAQLMATENAASVEQIVTDFLKIKTAPLNSEL